VVFAAFGLAFWLAEGFLSQHEANHNLYWVWLLHSIPFLGLLAAGGWGWVERRLKRQHRALRALAWVAVLLSVLPSFAQETRYQMERSSSWYRPQLELCTWIEEETPPDTGVLTGSLSEVWLKRKPLDLRVHAWGDFPTLLDEGGAVLPMDPHDFGTFLEEQRIDYVIWFAEEWTHSAQLAPWMMVRQNMTAGPVGLTAVDFEEGYGWVLYMVTRPGAPYPPIPPRYGSGVRGRGWSAR